LAERLFSNSLLSIFKFLRPVIVKPRCYKFQAIVFEEEKPKGEVRRKDLGGK